MAGHGLVTFEPGAGLQILRDVLSALAVLHDSRNVAHGSLAPERVVLTATGRVVMVEHVLGHALDRLQRPRHQLWREWRVPTPPAAGTVRFDMQTDFAQAGLLGLAVLLGRPIDEEEYPHRLRGLLPLVQDRLGRSPSAPIASDVVAVLERLAPVDSRRAFKTVRDAQQALEGLFSGGGAALGASPARVKSVVAAVAAIAAAEAPAASATDAAQAPAAIVVAAPVDVADVRGRKCAGASAGAAGGDRIGIRGRDRHRGVAGARGRTRGRLVTGVPATNDATRDSAVRRQRRALHRTPRASHAGRGRQSPGSACAGATRPRTSVRGTGRLGCACLRQRNGAPDPRDARDLGAAGRRAGALVLDAGRRRGRAGRFASRPRSRRSSRKLWRCR